MMICTLGRAVAMSNKKKNKKSTLYIYTKGKNCNQERRKVTPPRLELRQICNIPVSQNVTPPRRKNEKKGVDVKKMGVF